MMMNKLMSQGYLINGAIGSAKKKMKKNKDENKQTGSCSRVNNNNGAVGSINYCLEAALKPMSSDVDDDKYRKERTAAVAFRRAVVLRTFAIFAAAYIVLAAASSSLYAIMGFGGGNNNNNNTSSSALLLSEDRDLLLAGMSSRELQALFEIHRANDINNNDINNDSSTTERIVEAWLSKVDNDVINNKGAGGPRWARPYLLPDIHAADGTTPKIEDGSDSDANRISTVRATSSKTTKTTTLPSLSSYFKTERNNRRAKIMAWEREWGELLVKKKKKKKHHKIGPKVDYTNPDMYTYEYPDPLSSFVSVSSSEQPLPLLPPSSEYPKFQSFREILQNWKQGDDYLLSEDNKIHETLVRFDYGDRQQMKAAQALRDAELPFKVYNVPDLISAKLKWDDDEYVSLHHAAIVGSAEESQDHFFQGNVRENTWDVRKAGIPPVRENTEMNYMQFAKHARYADAISLEQDKPHYYWTSIVRKSERFLKEGSSGDDNGKEQPSFITRDLRNSLASSEPNFFVPDPNRNYGIQCRFGERGVVSELHIDDTKNAVALISGAKRYILSPPKECSKFGLSSVLTQSFLMSTLNLGNMAYLDDDEEHNNKGGNNGKIKMSDKERWWLERAGAAEAVETVLKEGEVLMIPTQWMHYIIGLQKNAQCNVHIPPGDGHGVFGGPADVRQCKYMQ